MGFCVGLVYLCRDKVDLCHHIESYLCVFRHCCGLVATISVVFIFIPLNCLSRQSSYISRHFCSFYALILCRDFVVAFVSDMFIE